jgi:hypothetical protein
MVIGQNMSLVAVYDNPRAQASPLNRSGEQFRIKVSKEVIHKKGEPVPDSLFDNGANVHDGGARLFHCIHNGTSPQGSECCRLKTRNGEENKKE